MRILVVSDTHNKGASVLREIFNTLNGSVEAVFHLGDGCEDTYVLPPGKVDVYRVRGNCDFLDNEAESLQLELYSKKIWLSHGHRSYVKSGYDEIKEKARSMKTDICIFGHTHECTCFREEGILFLNPGSLAYSRFLNIPTYGILELPENGDPAEAAIVGVYGTGIYRRM